MSETEGEDSRGRQSYEVFTDGLDTRLKDNEEVDIITSRLAKVRLRVVDWGSDETRICQFEETKSWDWSNHKLVRMVGGIQVTSWDKLVEVITDKVEKGYQEVNVYEAPGYMLITGG